MADYTGSLVHRVSGRVGGNVFQKDGKVRAYVPTTSPQTAAQVAVQQVLGSLSTAWNSLTDAQRQSFRDYGAAFPSHSVFNTQKRKQGKAAFVQLNMPLSLSGLSGLTEAPVQHADIYTDTLTAGPGIVPGVFTVLDWTVAGSDAPSVSGKVKIQRTGPLSNGRRARESDFRIIGYVDDTVLTFTDDTVETDTNYVYRVSIIAPDGSVSLPIQVRFTTETVV